MKNRQLLIKFLSFSFIIFTVGCSNSSNTTSILSTPQSTISPPSTEIRETKSETTSSVRKGSVVSTPTPAETQIKINAGLLLGLRSDSQNSYRTLWIAPVDGELKTYQDDFMLVPHGSNFWEIRPQSEKFTFLGKSYGEGFNDWTASYRYFTYNVVGEKPKLLSREELVGGNDSYGYNNNEGLSYKLYFVGNKYICFSKSSAWRGGSASYGYTSVIVTEIGQEKAISIKEFLKDNVTTYLDKISKVPIPIDNNMGAISAYIDENMWRLKREKGNWSAKLAQNLMLRRGVIQGEWFDIPLELPILLTTYDELNPNWDTIKKAIPEATDAVSSPTQDLLVVFTPENLLVYTHPMNGITKPVQTIELNKNESMIMAQWATGDYVDKWTQEVSKYLK